MSALRRSGGTSGYSVRLKHGPIPLLVVIVAGQCSCSSVAYALLLEEQ